MKQIDYNEARSKMLPGDTVAFGGKGYISSVIKSVTSCEVSHVGSILQANIPSVEGFKVNQLIESTSLNDGFSGVTVRRMSTIMQSYDGDIWWLPLSKAARAEFDEGRFLLFMLQQVGKPYDAPQAIMSAIDFLPDSKEDFSKLFCSEVCCAGFEKGFDGSKYDFGDFNSSEQTPSDLCRLKILDEPQQLLGHGKELWR
jgi:hypothetical protein